jgi:hypothetical protein
MIEDLHKISVDFNSKHVINLNSVCDVKHITDELVVGFADKDVVDVDGCYGIKSVTH